MLLRTHNVFDILLNYASIYMQILKKKIFKLISSYLLLFMWFNDTKKVVK